jgi:hypothetical protein
VTAVADLITRADRDRLLKRLAEWRALDGVMRERGGMAAVPEPPALHQMGAMRATTTDVRPEQPGGSERREAP